MSALWEGPETTKTYAVDYTLATKEGVVTETYTTGSMKHCAEIQKIVANSLSKKGYNVYRVPGTTKIVCASVGVVVTVECLRK